MQNDPSALVLLQNITTQRLSGSFFLCNSVGAFLSYAPITIQARSKAKITRREGGGGGVAEQIGQAKLPLSSYPQQERQKSNMFNKQNKNSAFWYISLLSLKDDYYGKFPNFWRFMKSVNTQRRIFLCLFKLGTGP